MLYIVPTPIGNLEDLSPRARTVLAEVDLVAAEDTRVAKHLFAALEIRTPLTSYHDHSERQKAPALVERMLAGESIALISDAGTPLVSDPGFHLVRAAAAAGIRVVPLPGPCAAIAALSGAGLPTDSFLYLGFLPRQQGKREAVLKARSRETATLVFYEAPHRLPATLTSVADVLGDRQVVACRSLTKVWEDLIRGTAREVSAVLAAEDPLKGEFTVVVAGSSGEEDPDEAKINALIDGLSAAGVSPSTIRDVVAGVFERKRRDVYQRALKG